MQLEVGKTYETRDGRDVEIVAYNEGHMWPYSGANRYTYAANGYHNCEEEPNRHDLMREVGAEELEPRVATAVVEEVPMLVRPPRAAAPVDSQEPAAPDGNPKTRAGGQNKLPLHLIPARSLAHVALAQADGGYKYQPYNWHAEPISASVYHGAMLRHINAWWLGEDYALIDDDNPGDGEGAHHLAHAVCCALMILDTFDSDEFNDNRPTGAANQRPFAELNAELVEKLGKMRARGNTKFDLHGIARANP